MPQFGRPSADTNNPGSYTDQAGGSVNIYLTIDEAVADDADFVRSPTSPANAVYVTALTSITDPVSSAGHIMRMRTSADQAAQETLDFTDELRQAYVSEASPGTLIATMTRLGVNTTAWTTTTYTLSAAEADAITNYASLFRRLKVNKP